MSQEKFSPAEIKVFDTLQNDMFLTDREIASNLSISVNTVRTHLKNMYKKRDISGRNSRFLLFQNKSHE